ncbi:hypothetical protein ACSBR2_020496 [Camellia fascicularis]
MPKKDSLTPKQEHPPQLQNSKVDENSTPESSLDQATKLPTLAKTDNATEKIASLNDAKLPKNVAQDSRLKSLKMMATNVVVVARWRRWRRASVLTSCIHLGLYMLKIKSCFIPLNDSLCIFDVKWHKISNLVSVQNQMQMSNHQMSLMMTGMHFNLVLQMI